jgi:polysaccharide lyase-like protein
LIFFSRTRRTRFVVPLALLLVMALVAAVGADGAMAAPKATATAIAIKLASTLRGDLGGAVRATAISSKSPLLAQAPVPPPASSQAAPPTRAVTGGFPVAYFAPGFVGPATRQFSQQFITRVGSYVQVTYPAGSSSPSSGHPGGAQASLRIAFGPVDNATLTYRIRFPAGFQWVKGGKLPGLCGGACYTGSNNGPSGFCARFMWRTAGAGEVLINDATTTGDGTSLGRGNWSWVADGNWHTVSERVHMNTPGVADGTIDVTVDGAHVSHDAGITFRVNNSVHIDSLMFSTFFGGHDSSWAPSSLQHIDFSSFTISR